MTCPADNNADSGKQRLMKSLKIWPYMQTIYQNFGEATRHRPVLYGSAWDWV